MSNVNEMASLVINAPIRVDTDINSFRCGAEYAYYTVLRPPCIGTHPSGAIGLVEYQFQTYQESIGRCALGMVMYSRPLTQKEVDTYELVPDKDNDYRYRQYAIEHGRITLLANGKKKVERKYFLAEDGLVWLTCSESKANEIASSLRIDAEKHDNPSIIEKFFVREVAEHSDIARPMFRKDFDMNPVRRAAGCS